MGTTTGKFNRIAGAIAEKTADLLQAPVLIVDDRGIVVASSDSHLEGISYDASRQSGDERLEVPFHVGSMDGRVVVMRPSEGETISPRLARVLVDLVINQTAVVDRLPNKAELKNKLIHDLLHGSIDNEPGILREAQILGMDLSQPRAVILIDASEYILGPNKERAEPDSPRVARRTQIIIGGVVDFFELPSDTICAYIGNGEVAVLKASNGKSLRAWIDAEVDARASSALNPSWAHLSALKRAGGALLVRLRAHTRAPIGIGIGRHHPGLDGLARSYQDARAALSLGSRFQGPNHVHCLDALGVAAFAGVSDERTKIELARHLIAPLDHEPELMKTVASFFAHDLSPSLTAQDLSIHRNTLSYRLDKITSLTGLDPRRFDDAVQMRVALVLRSLDPVQYSAWNGVLDGDGWDLERVQHGTG